MKKLMYLLLLLLPLSILGACDSDDQFPDVTLHVDFSGITDVDGEYYAVKGEPVTVDKVYARSMSSLNAALGGVTYYYDYTGVGYSNIAPFSAMFVPEKKGEHILQIFTTVLQEDKRITEACLTFYINVVDSPEDIPAGAATVGRMSIDRRVSPDTKPQ